MLIPFPRWPRDAPMKRLYALMRNTTTHCPACIPLLVLALLFPGCAPPKSDTTKANAASAAPSGSSSFIPGVLRQQMRVEPSTFDPAVVFDIWTYDIVQQIYEGLTGFNEKNEVVPLLAESMPKISPDGMVYTFTLRKGARFTNGRQVTADDVKYTITRMLDPRLASPTAMLELDDIVGAKEMNTGKAKEVAGITVVDDRTIRFRLLSPCPYFPGKLATVYIVAKEEVEKGPKNESGVHLIDATNAVGTGPFKLGDYRRQEKVTLVANADYWGGKPPLQRIERPIILDAKTARNLYDTGQLDLVDLTPADYSAVKSDPALKGQARITNRASAIFIQFSQKNYPPFRDKRVRQALTLATDRDAIVQTALNGAGLKADALLPPGLSGYSPSFRGLPFDQERAKKLLAEAGYSKDRPLPQFTILYQEKSSMSQLEVQMLQEQWAAIGVPTRLEERESAAFFKTLETKDYDAALTGWTPNYPDPQGIVSSLLCSNSVGNTTGYRSKDFDQVCGLADRTPNSPHRWELYQQALAIARDDAPLLPLCFKGDIELVSPHVSGLQESLIGRLPHTTTKVQ